MKTNDENTPAEAEVIVEEVKKEENPPEFLEVNVYDKVAGKAVGPGQL